MNHTKHLLLLFIPLLSACSYVVPRETDVSKEALKGRVMVLKENSFKAIDKFGDIQEGERARKSRLGFDYAKKFSKSGTMEEYSEFESKSGRLVYKSMITYNKSNKAITQHSYTSNKTLDLKSTYTYDDNGNAIEIAAYNALGKLSARYNYKYDDNGLVLVEKCYRADASFDWMKKYEYNRRGQVIEMFRDDSDDRFDCTYIYVYNQKHQLKEEIVKDADRIFDKRYVFSYDRKGNRVLEESYNSRAKLYSRLQYAYDKNGNKTQMSELYSGDKSLNQHRYDYTYDKKGNWIRRVGFYNDKAQYIITREITYHRGFSLQLPFALLKNKSGDDNETEKGIEASL